MADLKEHLRIPSDWTEDDDYLEALELSAVKAIERQTGHYFGTPEEVTELVSGGEIDGYTVLWLRDIPREDGITPGTTLEVETFDGDDWNLEDAADFELDGYGLYHDSAWPTGFRNVRVTYSRGYAVGEEPKDIREAVMQRVGDMYENREDAREDAGGDLSSALVGTYRRVRV